MASVAIRTGEPVAQDGQFADHIADATARGGGEGLMFENGEEEEHVAGGRVPEKVELVRRGAGRH